MGSLNCLTCGMFIDSSSSYHIHNLNSHTLEELSLTILKVLFKEKIILKKNLYINHGNTSSNGYLQECMDEVIELGTNEGDDNLTVQSLLLKSNFTPSSRHVIEVQEKKQPKDVIKILSQELNAAVVNFQNDILSTGISGCLSKQFEENQMKSFQSLCGSSHSIKKKVKKKRKVHSKSKQLLDKSPELSLSKESLPPSEKKPNVKFVLRSGRTIKTTPKYEDFIYYDYKENLSASNRHMTSQKESVTKITKVDNPLIGNSKKEQKDVDSHNIKLLDLLPEEFNFDDLNLCSELDIQIEDLDLSGFDDLDGTLPENQILTIENLLQELEGGGSIEISNIIKENNVDSDMVILDALSSSPAILGEDTLPSGDSEDEINDSTNSCKVKLKKSQNIKNYCSICKKNYVSKVNYKIHMEKFHDKAEKKIYKCSTCDQTFPFLASFERHYKEHNPNQTFLCEICGRNFKSLLNMKIHSALHKRNVTYQCHLCSNKYFLKYSYFSHMKSHEISNNFHCEKCDKYFSQKQHYNKHLTLHKTGKYLGISKDLKCNFCNDIILQNSPSFANMNFENCLKCKKGIYKKYFLVNEEYKPPEPVEKPSNKEECKICGKRVKHLQKHMRTTHLSNPLVECDLCGKTFKKASLNAHKLRIHKGIEAQCNHCDKKFKNALALREHLNKVKRNKFL